MSALPLLAGLAFVLGGPSLCSAQTTLNLGSAVQSDNLGIFAAGGKLKVDGSLAIKSGNARGNFGLGPGASLKENGSFTYHTGYTGLSTSALTTASSEASSLKQNGTLSNGTISGTGPLVVYDLSSITKNLTLQGSSTQTFVINVSGNITLNGHSSITLNGVNAANVLFNVGGSITTNGSNKLYGTFLDLSKSIVLNGTLDLHGSLIGGKAITNNGSTTVHAEVFDSNPTLLAIPTAPELPTIAIAATAFLFLIGKAGFDRMRR